MRTQSVAWLALSPLTRTQNPLVSVVLQKSQMQEKMVVAVVVLLILLLLLAFSVA
jgi:hypothetical protein